MGLCREGQTRSARNAKPLLTTIHPFQLPSRPLGEAQPRLFSGFISEIILARCTYVGHKPRIGSLVVFIVAAPLTEREVAIHGSAHHVCVVVILPIVLPPTHLA